MTSECWAYDSFAGTQLVANLSSRRHNSFVLLTCRKDASQKDEVHAATKGKVAADKQLSADKVESTLSKLIGKLKLGELRRLVLEYDEDYKEPEKDIKSTASRHLMCILMKEINAEECTSEVVSKERRKGVKAYFEKHYSGHTKAVTRSLKFTDKDITQRLYKRAKEIFEEYDGDVRIFSFGKTTGESAEAAIAGRWSDRYSRHKYSEMFLLYDETSRTKEAEKRALNYEEFLMGAFKGSEFSDSQGRHVDHTDDGHTCVYLAIALKSEYFEWTIVKFVFSRE